MKSLIYSRLSLLALFVLFLVGCSKDDVVQPGNGGNGGNPIPSPVNGEFRFMVAGLPGEQAAISGLSAVVNVVDSLQRPVWTSKKLALTYDGKYRSELLSLKQGNYRISSFLITDSSGKVRFIIPMANSAKASLVKNPLAHALPILKQSAGEQALEVARIAPGDKPEAFGYPAGTFETTEEIPAQKYLKILVQPLIKIGDIVYDSIPVSYQLTTWDSTGQASMLTGHFVPGKNELSLLKSASRYNLKVIKWGTSDEITLRPADVQEGTVYSLGGSRAAKKLRSELTYKLENGISKPETRAVYEYENDGRLSQVVHYLKRADNTTYIDMTEKFEYNGFLKPTKIKRYNTNNELIRESAFVYGNEGRVSEMTMLESGVRTIARVGYSSKPGTTGITGKYEVNARYEYSNSNITTNYTMSFVGGNNMADAATTSNHSSELGSYQYDFNINPYIHLNRPDVLMPEHSRHNATVEVKTYHGSYPIAVAYDFVYKYDADGYPTEVVKSYKSYLTGKFLYKIRTVFNY